MRDFGADTLSGAIDRENAVNLNNNYAVLAQIAIIKQRYTPPINPNYWLTTLQVEMNKKENSRIFCNDAQRAEV